MHAQAPRILLVSCPLARDSRQAKELMQRIVVAALYVFSILTGVTRLPCYRGGNARSASNIGVNQQFSEDRGG